MRYLIIVKATADTEAGVMPGEPRLTAMAQYHEQLAAAGVLVDGSGLQASSKGWRIRYAGDRRSFVYGPFAETRELIAGDTIIQVTSRKEAVGWSMRYPIPPARAGRPRSKCASSSSGKTSPAARRSIASARSASHSARSAAYCR